MKTNHIARFEALVERLVEGTFARLFASRLHPTEVANALARAMEDHAVERLDAAPLAPNYYRVDLHPADYEALTSKQPNLAPEMAQILFELAPQVGFALPDPPQIHLVPSDDVPKRQAQVSARWLPPSDSADGTREMPLSQVRAQARQALANRQGTRPFLILEGRRHLPLQAATVSLGRSFDNDVIVDDARVSRRHAQLRLRHGRYVIYDLGSSGGTSVNGYPVAECVLEPGDVISLAGVEVIYGEDVPESTHPPQKGELKGGQAARPGLPQTRELSHRRLPNEPDDPPPEL